MLWVPSTTAIIGRPANLRRTKRPKAADNGVAMNSCKSPKLAAFVGNPARCLWSGPDRVRCQGRCCHPWDWRPANDKLGRAACSASGCPAGGIRLTNWDAHALAEHVHKGTRWILLIDRVWVVPVCLKPKFPLVNARGRARNTHGYPLLELSLPDELPDFCPAPRFLGRLERRLVSTGGTLRFPSANVADPSSNLT